MLLVEVTQFIDNKVEAIFKVAQEERSDSIAHQLTNEFLEQLIEVVEDLCWLIVRIPVDRCGKHLLRRYENGFKEVLGVLRGIERIWRSIRSGHGSIPRNRDYTTEHVFKSLYVNTLHDTRSHWDSYTNQLKEFNDAIGSGGGNSRRESDGKFKEKCHRVIGTVYAIFKKIRLSLLTEHLEIDVCDRLLDSSESILLLVKESCRLLLIYPRSSMQVCDQIFKLNRKMHEMIEENKMNEEPWFADNLRVIDDICEQISEMNPNR